MGNYFLNSLENYFDEIHLIEARLILVNVGLGRFKNEMHEKSDQFVFRHSALTSFRDLSFLPKTDNIFSPNFSYDLELDDLNAEMEIIISRETCLVVSQAYEVFESFFIDILTTYFFRNQSTLAILKGVKLNQHYNKSEIREFVKERNGVNNKGLISLVRKVSSYYGQHEIKNCFEINISLWFDLLSQIRHSIIHNRQRVTKRLLDYLEKQKSNKIDSIFNTHFEFKKVNEEEIIFLTADRGTTLLCWLNSYAHFIFKCLSGAKNMDISVPLYSPERENLFSLFFKTY